MGTPSQGPDAEDRTVIKVMLSKRAEVVLLAVFVAVVCIALAPLLR
jgi:hypothetical protein